MTRSIALVALLALGCNPMVTAPITADSGADAPDVAPAADVVDAGSADAGVTRDGGKPCVGPRTVCAGRCTEYDDQNCGGCGRACTMGDRCCVVGVTTFCSANLNCER